MRAMLIWLRDAGGDLVWSTLVIVAVLMPLGGLSIDVSRYFVLRNTLASGADAAAAAAAQCLDMAYFQHTGETQLMPDCADHAARQSFTANANQLDPSAYHPRFVSLSIDEARDQVLVRAVGDLRLMFGLSPPLPSTSAPPVATAWSLNSFQWQIPHPKSAFRIPKSEVSDGTRHLTNQRQAHPRGPADHPGRTGRIGRHDHARPQRR